MGASQSAEAEADVEGGPVPSEPAAAASDDVDAIGVLGDDGSV